MLQPNRLESHVVAVIYLENHSRFKVNSSGPWWKPLPLENPSQVGTFVEVKGNSVFYRTAGSGEPIVLLHGFPTSSYDWRKILVPLSKIGTVIAPDLYGFGYTDLPKGDASSVAKLIPFLNDFVSEMQLQKFRLVAYDWGGGCALSFTVDHPASVSKLVLMNTTIYPDMWVEHFQHSPDYAQVRRMANSRIYRTIARTLISSKQVKQLIAPKPETAISSEELKQYRFFVKRGIAGMSTLYAEDSINFLQEAIKELTPKVSELEIPTLLLWSQNDPYVPPEHGERLSKDIKGSKLSILEDTGHFIVEERPQQVTDALLNFFAG